MREAGVIGIARVVMHTKERLAALIPDGEALMLNTIRWASELRPRDALDLPAAGKGKLKEGELKMARQLIGDMTSPWKPEDYEDKFTAAIHALAAQRVKAGDTEKVTPIETDAVPSAGNVVDLTELLRRSLDTRKPSAKAKKAARRARARRAERAPRRRRGEEGAAPARRLSGACRRRPIPLGSGMRSGRRPAAASCPRLPRRAPPTTSRRPRPTGRASRPRRPCRRRAGSRSRPAGSTTTPAASGATASRSPSSSPSIATGASASATRPGCGSARTPASRSGFGDTSVVLKRRFGIDDDQAFGLEASVTAPTGKSGIGFGSGKPDYAVNAIYSADFGAWHTDVNLLAARLGQVDPGASRTLWLFAASLSRQLDDRWGVVGEFADTRQSGAEDSRQLLLAASYNLSKRMTLDAGAARSVRRGDSAWSAFAGFTWLAARLF